MVRELTREAFDEHGDDWDRVTVVNIRELWKRARARGIDVRGVRTALVAMEEAGEVSVTDDQVQDLT